MFELRYRVVKWEEYRDGINAGIMHTEEPVLQYRAKVVHVDSSTTTPVPPDWSEWEDVPTEYIET